ncbi:hypothetical protein ASE21_04270 [Flavobacterium sp. Root901]|nr:hypothetical protein ASE21_04270 [Flavobacterium sp. Root901]
MTIVSYPLSKNEKRILKKIFLTRIIAGILLLPLFSFLVYEYISDFSFHNFDELQLFGSLLLISVFFLIFKYVIPGYIYSYKNIKAKNKYVASTFIIDFKFNKSVRLPGYFITLENNIKIDTTRIIVLEPTAFSFKDIYKGMPIRIHFLNDNKTDIIKIEKI